MKDTPKQYFTNIYIYLFINKYNFNVSKTLIGLYHKKSLYREKSVYRAYYWTFNEIYFRVRNKKQERRACK